MAATLSTPSLPPSPYSITNSPHMRLPFRSLSSNYKYYSYFNNVSLFSISIQHPIIKNAPTQLKFFSSTTINTQQSKEKIVVIMGPTGSGKTRLSIDLATRYFPSEIINSDKIQLYKGLNIITNKIPLHQRLGVPHHLLGDIDSALHGELTTSEFRSLASNVIPDIISRNKLPLVVGGSNSLIYALLADNIEPDNSDDVFSGSDPVCSQLRYKCCFLWIDVSLPVLNKYLVKRVDDMLDSGMLDELSEFYESGMIDEIKPNTGIRRAIGVPEFERYFRRDTCKEDREWDRVRRGVYDEAVRSIKENTCELAKIQMEKIQRLRRGGWGLWRIDGTDTLRGVLEGSKSWNDVWESQVVKPSMEIVKCFLEE